jgi:hypothetical protein
VGKLLGRLLLEIWRRKWEDKSMKLEEVKWELYISSTGSFYTSGIAVLNPWVLLMEG